MGVRSYDIGAGRGGGLDLGFQPDLSNQFAQPAGYGFGGMDMLANMFGGGGAPAGQERIMQMLAEMFQAQQQAELQAQVRPWEAFSARREAQDPIGWAIKQREAAQFKDPWGPGGAFEGRRAADLYTPEEILASQGPTAENQIKSLRRPLPEEQAKSLQGKVAAKRSAGEFDPEELRRLNQIYAARRSYT